MEHVRLQQHKRFFSSVISLAKLSHQWTVKENVYVARHEKMMLLHTDVCKASVHEMTRIDGILIKMLKRLLKELFYIT